MHGFQSSSCCVELGDHRVLQSEVENEQCLRRLVGRAHSDNSEPGHGGPWKLEDRPCTQHAQAHAANEAYHAEDQTQMPADRNGREDALLHSLLAGAGSERIVNSLERRITRHLMCDIWQTVRDRTLVVFTTAFDWYQNQWPLMTLNSVMTTDLHYLRQRSFLFGCVNVTSSGFLLLCRIHFPWLSLTVGTLIMFI